jgi:hypothetical protein
MCGTATAAAVLWLVMLCCIIRILIRHRANNIFNLCNVRTRGGKSYFNNNSSSTAHLRIAKWRSVSVNCAVSYYAALIALGNFIIILLI